MNAEGTPFGGYFRRKRVLVTGDTGFKGSWLCYWLQHLGANVSGVGLEPITDPALFQILDLSRRIEHTTLDIRDFPRVRQYVSHARPEVVFHLAAQALVRMSHQDPLQTLDTNVMGTAHLLKALSEGGYRGDAPCLVVAVTSDKCYENQESYYAYRETDPLGGHDIYSASKGAMEILLSAWRWSYCLPERFSEHGIALASTRAGNVIGGGDWAEDRIVPDSVRALSRGEPIPVRNPGAIRPWQHVLEPLSGYLHLACTMGENGRSMPELMSGWNFGPAAASARTVGDLVDSVIDAWGEGTRLTLSQSGGPPEAHCLRLAIDKAAHVLDWHPTWTFETAVSAAVGWYKEAYRRGCKPGSMDETTLRQIVDYTNDARLAGCRWASLG